MEFLPLVVKKKRKKKGDLNILTFYGNFTNLFK